MDDNCELEVLYPWINKDFFNKILSKEHPENNVEINNVEIKAALPKGENYTSQLITANVEYSLDEMGHKEIRFIIKTVIANDACTEEMFKELGLFKKEITAFQEILPQVKELLNGIGDDTTLASRCYDSSIQNSYIVFEDLTMKHFANVDKKLGLSFEHFKLIFTKLAKWHATTAILGTKNISLMDLYRTHYSQEPNSILKLISNNSITLTTKISKLFPGFEHISKKLANLSSEKFYQKLLDVIAFNEIEFNVLTHGDLWMNNIMFTHNENGQPTDCIFVDFQVGYWGSPVLDILNNYFTSFHEDLCETDLDLLVQHYFQVLESTLIKLNYSKPIPMLADIQEQISKKGIYGCPMGIMAVGGRNLEAVEVTDVSQFMDCSEEAQQFRLKMISKPQCRKAIEFMLNYYERMGYYD